MIRLTMECEVDDLGGTLDGQEAEELAVLRALRRIVHGELVLSAKTEVQGYNITDDDGRMVGDVVLDRHTDAEISSLLFAKTA